MKEIQLTQGKVALVDDADFEYLNQWKWHASKKGNLVYAKGYLRGRIRVNGKVKWVSMHRIILGLTDPKIWVDHKDHNGLNNQRENLRACTVFENQRNAIPIKGASSKYKGVCLLRNKYHNDKINKRWIAKIYANNKGTYLGRFKNEEDAARAYNEAAIKHYGEFACLNIIETSQI